MSADNWAYCPKCQPEGALDNEELYGEHLLREDYEQGMGQACRKCGFNWSYRHEEQAGVPL
jgi:hypothetical protein